MAEREHEHAPEPEVQQLERLRAAFLALEPQEVGTELETEDPQTRAVVGWLHAAWNEIEVPTARPPKAASARSRLPGQVQPSRIQPSWIQPSWIQHWTLAASILIGLGLLAIWSALRTTRRPGPGPEPRAASDAAQVRVAAVTPESIELSYGCVRLVLIETAEDAQAAD